MLSKKRLWIAVATVFCLAFLGGVPLAYSESPGVTKDSISIGMIQDLTGPGAYVGKQFADAAKVLFKHINNQGGINGRKLKLYIQDNRWDPVKTIAAAKYLISRHNIFAITDVFGSTATVSLFPLIMEKKIPTLLSSNHSSVMYIPQKKYVFTAITTSSDSAVLMVDYIVNDIKDRNPRLGICYQDDEWGKDGLRGWEKAAKKYGFKVVGKESFKRGSADFSSQVYNLRKSNPDYVYLIGIGPSALIMKEAYKIGWSPQFMADQASAVFKVLELAGDAAKGFLVTGEYAIEDETVPGMVKLKKITNKYRPDIKRIDIFYTDSWVNILSLFEGLRRAGRDVTREGFVKALESFKKFETGGLAAPITYGPDIRNGGGFGRILRANTARVTYVPVTAWRKPSTAQ